MVYAGTGIVSGSDPSSEWNELELKISQVRNFVLKTAMQFSCPYEIGKHIAMCVSAVH